MKLSVNSLSIWDDRHFSFRCNFFLLLGNEFKFQINFPPLDVDGIHSFLGFTATCEWRSTAKIIDIRDYNDVMRRLL